MKLAVLGGAGVRSVFLAKGVAARAGETGIDELALFDIDERRLSLMAPLSARAAELAGSRLRVSHGVDLDAALDGAGAVITTFRVGGDHSRIEDEALARRHGLLPQETTGLGGFLMAMRSIPVMRDYCERIRCRAPGAPIFNFANPSGLVTQAMHGAGFGEVIGICDTPSSTNLRIAEALGIAASRLDIGWAGLNHLSWIFSLVRDGREVLPELVADPAFLGRVHEFSMFDPDLISRLGCLPNEYLYYYYYRERAVANIRAGARSRGEFIEGNNRALFEELSRLDLSRESDRGLALHAEFMRRRESSYMSVETGAASASAGQPEKRSATAADEGVGYAKVVLDLLEAKRSGRQARLVLSVRNGMALPFLAPDDVVEISCRAGAGGVEPLSPGHLPDHARLLMIEVKRFERLAAKAALEGDPNSSRALAIDALMAHPLIGSYSLAAAIADDALPRKR